MNERIRELIEQAWFDIEGPASFETQFGTMIDMRKELIDELSPILERYTELIVRECAKVVDDKLDFESASGPDDWASGADVLNHFEINHERTN